MLKRILLAALWLPLMALAQSYPSPHFNNVTIDGTLNAATIGLTNPLPVSSGGTGSSSATGATSNLQYLQGSAGSGARSLTSKLQDIVSILDFPGCDKTGTADSTSCIQTALNSGALGIYVPSGKYKFTSLTIPATVGLTIFGDGPKSCLLQNGTGIKYPTQASIVFPTLGTIRDLCFDGTNGSGNTLDTTYSQNTDLLDLYFLNPPTSFSSLKMDGNPTSSTYMHDMRVRNIRVYNNASLAGKAGIELGAFAADTSIDGYIGNGNFATQYMLLADAGAQTTTISNSHPYNAAINVVRLAGSNNNFAWNNVVIDNASNDLFYSLNNNNGRFTNVYLEQIHSGFSGVVYDNSYNNKMVGVSCNSNGATSVSCVGEINGSSGNNLTYGTVDNVANYSNVFNLTGLRSSAESMGLPNTIVLGDAITGNSPLISAQGTDTNVALSLSSQGTNGIAFYTRHFGLLQAEVIDTPSVNRFLTFTGSNGGNPTIGTNAGNVAFGTAISPSTTAGIIGTTAGDNANAGSFGEYLTATTASTSLTSGVVTNATSLTLTAGDWDVRGIVTTIPAGSTTTTQYQCGLSTTSATYSTVATGVNNANGVGGVNVAAGVAVNVSAPITRISVSASTTIYLVTNVSFATSTLSVAGWIGARRIR